MLNTSDRAIVTPSGPEPLSPKLISPSVLPVVVLDLPSEATQYAIRTLVRPDDLLVVTASVFGSGNQMFIAFEFPAQHTAEISNPAIVFTPSNTPSVGPFGWIGCDGSNDQYIPPAPPDQQVTLNPMWWGDLRLPGTSLLFLIPGITPSADAAKAFLSQPLSTLLDWSKLQLCIGSKAPSAGLFTSQNLTVPPGPAVAADAAVSSLSMMFGVLFSLTELGVWTHVDSPVTSGNTGYTELWHTRLVPGPSGAAPTMRAAWSLHDAIKVALPQTVVTQYTFPAGSPPGSAEAQLSLVNAPPTLLYGGLPYPNPTLQPSYLPKAPPDAWVQQPSTVLTTLAHSAPDGSAPPTSPMLDLVQYTTFTSAATPGVELPAEDVLLSALGGSLKTGGDFSQLMIAGKNTLVSLEHEQHLGRDTAANNVVTGQLYPFGHSVIFGTAIQREIDSNGSASLSSQYTIRIVNRLVVCPPLQDFLQPFQSVTVVTKSFPVLMSNGQYYSSPDGQQVMVQYEAIDAAGHPIAFTLPLSLQAPSGDLNISLNQQRLAYSAATNSTFETSTLTMQCVSGYNWQVKQAQVSHPAVSHFTSQDLPLTIVPPPSPGGDTIATILQPSTLDGTKQTSQYGAFAAPHLSLASLSKSLGVAGSPIPDPSQGLNAFSSAIEAMFGSTLLLGVFQLSDLVKSIVNEVGPSSLPLPAITSANEGGAVTVTMEYPAPNSNNSGNLAYSATISSIAKLTIASIQFTSIAKQAPSGTRTEGTCTLTNPLIQIPAGDDAKLVAFEFNTMLFTASSAAKPTASVEFKQVQFFNDLSFVNAIIEILPSSLFSNPPEMTITDTECVVSCGVDFPSIGIGVFELANINLDATLTIPFVADPASPSQITFEFDFATLNNPFTLSVMGFAGSGSFGISIAPNAVTVNGSLAFGGAYSVNVIVAQGSVSLEAGVHITYTSSPTGTAQATVDVGGFIHLHGGVDVLDLVSVTLDVLLSLDYDSGTDSFTGTAQVSLSVEVLLFHASVSFSISETFAGSSAPSSTMMEIVKNVPSGGTLAIPGLTAGPNPFAGAPSSFWAAQESDWANYCGAFTA